MRAYGEPDAFPFTDLGLRRSVGKSGIPVSPTELLRMADSWRPWRAYAAMHLWASDTEAASHRRARSGACRATGLPMEPGRPISKTQMSRDGKD
jgi:AraC family transcriptional regulator, regulatory protein of adaptative response / DNA-3-methyladenine glycosylase II